MRVMVIQAEVMPEHILVATAEVAEQEMIQIRLKRVLMDLTESAAAIKMALSIQLVPYMAEEGGQGHTTRDFGEPTGKRNAGGGGSDRNINGGMGGESDYDKGCGTGNGNRKSGGYGGGGCGTYGAGGDGTVLIRGKRYKTG